MATFTITENARSISGVPLATHTFTITSANYTQPLNSEEVTINPPTMNVKYNNSTSRNGISDAFNVWLVYGSGDGGWSFGSYSTGITYLSANTVKAMPTNGTARKPSVSYFFNSNNPTTKTVSLTWQVYIYANSSPVGTGTIVSDGVSLNMTAYYQQGSTAGRIRVNEGTLTINTPPTFDNSTLYLDTQYDYPYTGLTTASVDVSNMTAYYGGYITKAELTIGNQTATLTGDATNTLSSGTLSILLNQVGTFTPTVVVTDSRGQTQTVSLDAITIKGYTSPQIVINDIDRANAQKQSDDEGECALVTASITWTSAIADLTAPTVVAKDLDGNTVTTTTTWYTDKACTTLISDWSTVSAMPIYGFISNANDDPFDLQNSYNVTITPVDDMSSGTSVTATLGGAFYTMDFLAGGHGIAFGKPSSQPDLFECDLNAQFNNDLVAQDMTTQEVADFVDSIGGGTGAFADKVVEQGTDGIWTYRKWASGIAECWGTQTVHPNFATAYGSVYVASSGAFTFTFPSGLFTTTPTIEASIDLRGGVGGTSIQSAVSTGFNLYAFNAMAFNATARDIELMVSAKGRWN